MGRIADMVCKSLEADIRLWQKPIETAHIVGSCQADENLLEVVSGKNSLLLISAAV